MNKTIIAAMGVFATALLSCTTREILPEDVLDYASDQAAEITVAPGGGEINLAFVSTADWNVLTVENWFDFEQLSGKGGNNKLAVKVSPNHTGVRSGVIRIESGEKTLPFTIHQDVSDYISALGKTEFEVAPKGGSVELSFSSTNNWTAATEASWLALSQTEGEPGKATVTATAEQNTEEARTATVVVTCGEEKVEFTIYQDLVEIEEWTLLGTGKYREDFFAGIWEMDNEEVDVVIYENAFTPGTYKIENMFASALEACFGGTLAQIEAAGYYKYVPTDIIIETANGQAFIDDQPTGIIDLDDDPDWAGEYMIGTLQLGSIKDGVITFPTKGLLLSPPAAYAEGKGYYANTSGKFRITLPGYGAEEDFPIDLSLEFDLASNLFTNGTNDKLGFIVESATIDDIVSLTYLCADTETIGMLGGPSIDLVESYGSDISNYISNIKSNGYLGLSFNDMSSNTDYTLCVMAVNNAGDKLLVWDTAMIPVGNTGGSGSIGERAGGGGTGGDTNGAALVTGTYNIYDIVATNSGDKEYEGDFTVIADSDYNDGIHFIVDGIAGVSGCDWKAVYSASAGTLTLDGFQKGYEQYGNSFGEAIADAGAYYAGVYSYTTYSQNGAGKDPCVLTVDTKTGELKGLKGYLALNAIDKNSFAVLGFFEMYTPTSAITFLSPEVQTNAKVVPLNAGSMQRATLKTTAKGVRQYKADNPSFRTVVDTRFVTAERKANRIAKHGTAEKVSKAR